MSEPQVLVLGMGELIRAVRAATAEAGRRVISVDRIAERQLSFRLVDGSCDASHEWRINLGSVQDRPKWGIDDPDVVSALSYLLRDCATREIFADWLSHRVSLEEAVTRARAYLGTATHTRSSRCVFGHPCRPDRL